MHVLLLGGQYACKLRHLLVYLRFFLSGNKENLKRKFH